MSKELMEQLINQTLEDGHYYFASKMGGTFIYNVNPWSVRTVDAVDVIGKVPDYEEFIKYYAGYNHFKKECRRLEDDLRREVASNEELCEQIKRLEARLAKVIHEENDKLRKQLRDANSVIRKELRKQSPKGGVVLGELNDYLEKYGIRK